MVGEGLTEATSRNFLCIVVFCVYVARFFEQYGRCVRCPSRADSASIASAVGLPLFLAAVFGLLYAVRDLMPPGLLKVRSSFSLV